MFRRGTASALEAFGLAPHLINLHMGWSTSSNMMNTYRRRVLLTHLDGLFFHDLLKVNQHEKQLLLDGVS
jgi:hypothetical protein